MSVPTKQQISEFLSHVESSRRLPIAIIYESGLRLAEVTKLKVKDFKSRKMTLVVGRREVPVPLSLKSDLSEAVKSKDPDSLIFGFGMSERSLKRIIKHASEISGIKVTSHVLQQAFAIHALESGQKWEDVRDVTPYTPGSFRTLLPRSYWVKSEASAS